MSTTIVGVIAGVAAFVIVGSVSYLIVRLYRGGGERQRGVLRAAVAAAFVLSASQVAASNGGYAASFPIVFAGWTLLICLAVVVVNGVRRRRRLGHEGTAP